jgi:hypothetical protein
MVEGKLSVVRWVEHVVFFPYVIPLPEEEWW